MGSALAVAGATFQGIFRNPLVSPDLLVYPVGLVLAQPFAILLGFGLFAIQGFAFVGRFNCRVDDHEPAETSAT